MTLSLKLMALALLAVVFMAVPEAVAQPKLGTVTATDGKGYVSAVTTVVQSNFGLLIGLLIALLGMWMWLMDQNSWGVVLMIGGVAITAFPGIFGALYDTAGGTMEAFGANKTRADAAATNK